MKEKIEILIEEAEKNCYEKFSRAEKICLNNQKKVLDAFRNNRIALRHFAPSTGYGYDDIGRNALSKVYAEVFGTESAIVSPLFSSGTHTISTALFGLLRPGDTVLSITGRPYNTLIKVIESRGTGSLNDFGINFRYVQLAADPLQEDEVFDWAAIRKAAAESKPKLIYIQRAKGYEWRTALSVAQIREAVVTLKSFCDAPVAVDNCYGELVEAEEPGDAGADIIMGSLIKNPGGGLAPTGGYIAGKTAFIAQISGRYSAPGTGFEIGSYAAGYQYFFQGLFIAPHIVLQAVKSSLLFGEVFSKLGYNVLGGGRKAPSDITCAIEFDNADELLRFCRCIQSCSPVDSFVTPCAADMPGYAKPIVMAAGTFIQGASIELSADGPVNPPYIAYLQGGLTYEHARIAVFETARHFINQLT